MSDPTDDRARAVELMLDYLKGSLADQLATLRDVDTKVNIRLTIFEGILGLVTLGLPAIAGTRARKPCAYAAVLSAVVFGICLLRGLWLALSVLKVRVDLAGTDPGVGERVAENKHVRSVKVLRELV